MPVNVEPRDLSADLADLNSVLIVTCPVCPPMCVAMQQETPFIEFFKQGTHTPAFDDYIRSIRDPLDAVGVRTGVYTVHAPTPMMCLWTERQRNRLRKRAQDFDAVVVLACDSGVVTISNTLEGCECKVIPGMDTSGLINATTAIRFPLTVSMTPNQENSATTGHPG